MKRIFISLQQDAPTGKEYFLEWSTIVDAPMSKGMSLEEFVAYFKTEHPNDVHLLHDILQRVAKNGHSSIIHDSIDSIIMENTAGDDDQELTKKQIIEKYCLNPH